MFWSVFGHDAACCNFVSHNESVHLPPRRRVGLIRVPCSGYSLYYPNGNGGNLPNNILALSQHFYR